jgi:hypothetical protein
MRRRLHLRIVFEPARLSAEHLRRAYEIVVPIARREVEKKTERANVDGVQTPLCIGVGA